MHYFIRPRYTRWHINALIAFMVVFFVWYRFFNPEESPVVETLRMQAEVVSETDAANANKSTSFNIAKVKLPDGTHAYVSWQYEQPNQGDLVTVEVDVREDGTRRVSLREF
ncbi:MAG: hypothetical protein AB8B87_10635 [Granulosicoccus sp.]